MVTVKRTEVIGSDYKIVYEVSARSQGLAISTLLEATLLPTKPLTKDQINSLRQQLKLTLPVIDDDAVQAAAS
jgi:DNA-binding transcriptional regulator YiaG